MAVQPGVRTPAPTNGRTTHWRGPAKSRESSYTTGGPVGSLTCPTTTSATAGPRGTHRDHRRTLTGVPAAPDTRRTLTGVPAAPDTRRTEVPSAWRSDGAGIVPSPSAKPTRSLENHSEEDD